MVFNTHRIHLKCNQYVMKFKKNKYSTEMLVMLLYNIILVYYRYVGNILL